MTTTDHPAVFLPEPQRHDGTTATWRVEIDLERHDWLPDHLVDGQPAVPATALMQIAAEAAVSFAPELSPVGFTDFELFRFVRAPVSRWPRAVDVTATRSGDAVHVRLDSPPLKPVPPLEHARMTVRLGVPDAPERVEARSSSEYRLPADGRRSDGYLLPGVTLDALLRAAVPAAGDPGTEVVPTAARSVDVPFAVDDRELARRWGDTVLLHRPSTPDGGSWVASAVDGTVLLRVEGVTADRREDPDLASMRKHRTGAKTPRRAVVRKR